MEALSGLINLEGLSKTPMMETRVTVRAPRDILLDRPMVRGLKTRGRRTDWHGQNRSLMGLYWFGKEAANQNDQISDQGQTRLCTCGSFRSHVRNALPELGGSWQIWGSGENSPSEFDIIIIILVFGIISNLSRLTVRFRKLESLLSRPSPIDPISHVLSSRPPRRSVTSVA